MPPIPAPIMAIEEFLDWGMLSGVLCELEEVLLANEDLARAIQARDLKM